MPFTDMWMNSGGGTDKKVLWWGGNPNLCFSCFKLDTPLKNAMCGSHEGSWVYGSEGQGLS